MTTTALTIALLLGALGLAAGFAGGLWAAQGQGLSRTSAAERDAHLIELADSRFREASAGARMDLDQRRQAVEHLVHPLQETLARVESQLHQLERARLSAYTSLTEQVGFARESSEQLRTQTTALATALRAPQSRGRWGEMHLRRVAEIAGMVEHCDFDTQVSATTDDGRPVRPDLVVRLAGGKSVVVDAKVPLSAYLDAAESTSEASRVELLAGHARALRVHVDALAAKEYWTAFQPSPELVVLFVPGEAFLGPALEADPRLLDHAMRKGVVLATPTTLLTMLRTVAYTWQQEALTEHAKEIFEVGRELHKRVSILGGTLDKLGGSLRRAVEHYNGAIGTLERGVLVQARRMADLGLTDRALPQPQTLEATVRPLAAPELLDGAA